MFEVPISISVHFQFQLTLPSSPRAATTSHGDARSGRPKQSLKASSVANNICCKILQKIGKVPWELGMFDNGRLISITEGVSINGGSSQWMVYHGKSYSNG